MPFIRFEFHFHIDRLGRSHKSEKLIAICDQCGQEYTKNRVMHKHPSEEVCRGKLLFCTAKCHRAASKKDGIIDKKAKAAVKEKYGVDNMYQLEDVKVKIKQIHTERYGGIGFASDVLREKVRDITEEKYGVRIPLHSEEILSKKKLTCQEKYDVDHPMQNAFVKQKIKKTLYELYGGIGGSSDVILSKMRETCQEKYGTVNVYSSEYFKCLMQERYGVDSPMRSTEIRLKAHETMKREGTYGKSRPEDKLYCLLCEKFGTDNIERQKHVNNSRLDFYIKSIDTYVQLDGIYWHGLNRPISEIAKFKSPRDRSIFNTYFKDITQNDWFQANGLCLIRITDKELLVDPNECMKRIQFKK